MRPNRMLECDERRRGERKLKLGAHGCYRFFRLADSMGVGVGVSRVRDASGLRPCAQSPREAVNLTSTRAIPMELPDSPPQRRGARRPQATRRKRRQQRWLARAISKGRRLMTSGVARRVPPDRQVSPANRYQRSLSLGLGDFVGASNESGRTRGDAAAKRGVSATGCRAPHYRYFSGSRAARRQTSAVPPGRPGETASRRKRGRQGSRVGPCPRPSAEQSPLASP